ncbi:MAG: PAS domain S-box protein [Herpetosiphonaceae bacterium]|nr:PAS domain S-box protein [Herpetosiphonaceae bacterium]
MTIAVPPPAVPWLPNRGSDEHFWTLFDCSSDGIVLMDPHAQDVISPIIDCNASFCRMNGYIRAELLGQSIHLLNIHQPKSEGGAAYLAQLRQQGRMLFEDYHRRKDRSIFPVAISTALIMLDGRELVVGIDRDISGRNEARDGAEQEVPGHAKIASLLSAEMVAHQQANEALRESEGRFQLLFEHSPDGVVLIDPHHPSGSWPIVDCNAAFCRMNGYTREEFVGQFIDMLYVNPAESGDYLARLRIVGMLNLEALHRRKDGTVFPVEVATALVQLNGRELLLQIDRDISERKRVEAELVRTREAALEASRMKSEFLAMMSHEIRTPMNGVVGMADLLLDTHLDDEQREYATTITESALALLTILNDILDFSKIEAGKLDLEITEIDPRALIRRSLDLLWPKAREHGITLCAEIAPEVGPLLSGDPTRLRQVLLNLLSNAVKFTEQGEVILHAAVVEQAAETMTLRFEIVDTGPGIAPDVQARLFQPFTQADGSTTRRYGGTGLGLAISKRLVELMGGTIGVESAPGSGSIFWLQLPLARAQALPSIPPSDEPNCAPVAAVRILIAEDNLVNQKVALMQLRKLGYEADIVATGRAAVTAAATGRYGLILMDLHMPEMDGYTAAALIRAHEAANPNHCRLPIVALTASALQIDRDACLASGMDDYLPKPFKLDDLRMMLNNRLQAPVTG